MYCSSVCGENCGIALGLTLLDSPRDSSRRPRFSESILEVGRSPRCRVVAVWSKELCGSHALPVSCQGPARAERPCLMFRTFSGHRFATASTRIWAPRKPSVRLVILTTIYCSQRALLLLRLPPPVKKESIASCPRRRLKL